MCDILFRGKRVDTKEWVEGDLIRHYENQRKFIACDQMAYTYTENGINRLVSERYFEVIPETVGQYTGLKDKNGKMIFEGDIVSGTALSRERTGVIVWIEQLAGFGVRYAERDDPTAWQESSILRDIERHKYSDFCAKVIGNIHDNHDLLKEKINK